MRRRILTYIRVMRRRILTYESRKRCKPDKMTISATNHK